MKNLNLAGRILYAIPFLVFGIMHLMNAQQMAGMVPSFLPGGVFWIYLTGLVMIVAAIGILSGKQTRNTSLLLAILLIIYIIFVHVPGLGNPDQMMKQMAMMSLLKDTGLAGGALVIAAGASK